MTRDLNKKACEFQAKCGSFLSGSPGIAFKITKSSNLEFSLLRTPQNLNLGYTSTRTANHNSATFCDNSKRVQKYDSRFNTRQLGKELAMDLRFPIWKPAPGNDGPSRVRIRRSNPNLVGQMQFA